MVVTILVADDSGIGQDLVMFSAGPTVVGLVVASPHALLRLGDGECKEVYRPAVVFLDRGGKILCSFIK